MCYNCDHYLECHYQPERCNHIIYLDGERHYCVGVHSHLGDHKTACGRTFNKNEVRYIDGKRTKKKVLIAVIILGVLYFIWELI